MKPTITPLDASVVIAAVVFLLALRWYLRAVPGRWAVDRGHRLPDRRVMTQARRVAEEKAEIQQLVKDWREIATDFRGLASRSESSTNQDVYRANAKRCERCADQLEKVILARSEQP